MENFLLNKPDTRSTRSGLYSGEGRKRKRESRNGVAPGWGSAVPGGGQTAEPGTSIRSLSAPFLSGVRMFKGRCHPGDVACAQAMRARNLAPLRDSALYFADNFPGRGEFQAALARHSERHLKRGGIVRFINCQTEHPCLHVGGRRIQVIGG